MSLSFIKYFFSYIFNSKTRQKLIFLSVIGLVISAFSLTVIQGIMGGLQNGLVNRSKNVLGHSVIDVKTTDQSKINNLKKELSDHHIDFVPELEIELLLQNTNYIKPVIIHGMDFKAYTPKFLANKNTSNLVLGGDLARDIKSYYGSKLKLTSPSHFSFIFTEIPRQGSIVVSDFYTSELPEIDSFSAWVRLSFIQNLIRQKKINKIRIFTPNSDKLFVIVKNFKENEFRFRTWEDENSTLVWALNLETRVMMFLFAGMSFLIGICIISGFLIFYNKVKIDLASFWLLGLSTKHMYRLIYIFGQLISLIFCLLGVGVGLAFLWLLKSNNFILMPDLFVERNIPVKIEYISLLISFFIPYLFATVFTHITFKLFRDENGSFLNLIKKDG